MRPNRAPAADHDGLLIPLFAKRQSSCQAGTLTLAKKNRKVNRSELFFPADTSRTPNGERSVESTLHSIAVNYKSCLVRSNDCETQSNVCFSAPSEAPGYRSLPPPRENTFFLTFSAYRAGLSGELSEDINISVLVHKMKFLKKDRGCLSKRSADRGWRDNLFLSE